MTIPDDTSGGLPDEAAEQLDARTQAELAIANEANERATVLKGISGRMQDTADVLTKLADRVDRQGASIRLLSVALALLVVVVVAVGVALVVILDLSRETRDDARQNRDNGDILIECTTATPDDDPATAVDESADPHECYERGQAAQGAAVLAIVECTRLPDGTPREVLFGCVVEHLRSASTTTSPPP